MGNEIQSWEEQNSYLVARGIDESTWNALCSTIYPGAKPDSIVMAIDYCHARQLDIMLKPVHLVPMSIKDGQTGNYSYRDVPMPGVGLYRIQAERTGNYVGADAPEFGPMIEREFQGKNNKTVTCRFPEWCKYTVYKLARNNQIVAYSALEYWEENYATAGKDSEAPNAMWLKRPRGQLAKCSEAQALRRGWPEIGQEATAEEMEGKHRFEKELNPASAIQQKSEKQLPVYTQEQFIENANKMANAVSAGRKTPEDFIQIIESQFTLPEEIRQQIETIVDVPEEA